MQQYVFMQEKEGSILDKTYALAISVGLLSGIWGVLADMLNLFSWVGYNLCMLIVIQSKWSLLSFVPATFVGAALIIHLRKYAERYLAARSATISN